MRLEPVTGDDPRDILRALKAALHGAGTSEHFTRHPLNGDGADYDRYNIWGATQTGSACLEADSCEVLSYSMNQAEADAGVIGMAVYENAAGGRVAVSARGPWYSDVLGLYKTQQIKNTFDWLCGGLPAQVDSTGRAGCSVWESADGSERTVFIYNTDFDDATDAVLRTDGTYAASLLLPDGSLQPLGAGKRFALPVIPAWSTAVVLLNRQ